MTLIHEMFGVISERLEREQLEHQKSLDLIRRVAAGEIDTSLIVVTESGWTLRQPEESDDELELPELVNGELRATRG